MAGEFLDTLQSGTEMSELLQRMVYLIGINLQKRRVREWLTKLNCFELHYYEFCTGKTELTVA
jgi:hypothetical protein